MEDDTPNLPYDIIENNILSRLPVESLLRFKSISKSWYSIISDTKFARFHLQISKKNKSNHKSYIGTSYNVGHGSNPEMFGILMPDQPKFQFLKLTNHNFQRKPLDIPGMRSYIILCSCDGLVLLINNSSTGDNMCIWNPSTRAYNSFSCNYDFWRDKYIFGFCYDASTDDYKIVISVDTIRYAIYSYKNNEWIEKEDRSSSISDHLSQYPRTGVYVHGALHWIGYETKGSLHEKTYKICCFDPRDDEFKKLSILPSWFDGINFSLTELREQLCLYRTRVHHVEAWIYGDCNSWNKILSIEDASFFLHKPLCLTNENDVVLDIYGSLAIYNSEKEKVIARETFVKISCFDESLIFPSRRS